MKHGGNVWEGGDPRKWLDFSANLRPEGPPEWALQTMWRALYDTRYYPDRSLRVARAGLAAYLDLPMENVLPTAGGAAAIDMALSLREGRVMTESVTFGEYAQRARVHGRPVTAGLSGVQPSDTVVICNPNNPSGRVQTPDALLKWKKRLQASGQLIVDEAFIDFCPANTVRKEVDQSLIVVGSLTKTLGLPGVRLGYICADAAAIQTLEQRALPWSLGTLAQALAAELPHHKAEIEQDAVQNVLRRTRFEHALSRLGATFPPSAANFILAHFDRDMTDIVQQLKQRGILVRTCQSFGLDESYLRLAVKLDGQNDLLIEELKKCLY